MSISVLTGKYVYTYICVSDFAVPLIGSPAILPALAQTSDIQLESWIWSHCNKLLLFVDNIGQGRKFKLPQKHGQCQLHFQESKSMANTHVWSTDEGQVCIWWNRRLIHKSFWSEVLRVVPIYWISEIYWSTYGSSKKLCKKIINNLSMI